MSGGLVWKVQRRLFASGDGALLRKLGFEVSDSRARELLDELRSSTTLARALQTTEAQRWFEGPQPLDAQLALDGTGRGRALLLYAAVRLLRPDTIVETGCFTGWDSAVFLEALERNAAGHLYTVDLPARAGQFSQEGPRSGLLAGLETGFLVPDELRGRWTLTLGDARNELPALLERLGEIDLFFHDSDHSAVHMAWEFETAWPYLSKGGLLVSDDISWNTSVRSFARTVGHPLVIHRRTPNVGAVGAKRTAPVRRKSVAAEQARVEVQA